MPVALHKLQRTVPLNVANPSFRSSESYDSQRLLPGMAPALASVCRNRGICASVRRSLRRTSAASAGNCQTSARLRRWRPSCAGRRRVWRRTIGPRSADGQMKTSSRKLQWSSRRQTKRCTWIEHVSAIAKAHDLEPLRQEANELVAIFTTAHKTAKANLEKKKALKRRRNRPT